MDARNRSFAVVVKYGHLLIQVFFFFFREAVTCYCWVDTNQVHATVGRTGNPLHVYRRIDTSIEKQMSKVRLPIGQF